MSNANRVPNRLLRHERKARKWTQSYVAKQIDTDAFTVSRWESGKTFPSPEHRLKLCELFQMSMAELGLISPSAVAEPTRKHANSAKFTSKALYDPAIPHTLSALVGRESILASLKRLLIERKRTTTFALQGLPGVGKTALAVALASDQEVRATFSDGILWAGLGFQPNVADLLSHWSQLLGLNATSMQKIMNREEVVKAIRAAISTQRMLIIIDDAWTVEDVFAFHVGGPNCAYLLTTRHTDVALHSAGHTSTIDELDEDDGVALLVRLAPASKHVLHDVHTLVRAVGGLPLALTLMGRYVHTETYNKHIRRLSHAIERLHSAEERLRLTQPLDPTEGISSVSGTTTFSLQAVIAVSDQHLTQEARLALRALAIFPPKPNTFQEEAALATASIAATTLDELTDAGLIESQGQGYYTLHQVIADYARTIDDRDTSVRKAVEERMVSFYVDLIQAQSQHPEALERDSQNILVAFEVARKRSLFTPLLDGVNAFAPFWIVRGQQKLAIHHLRTAQQIALQQGDTRNVALTWVHLGRIAALHGNLAQADAYYGTGLNYARKSGDPRAISTLLNRWCELMLSRGEHKRAKHYIKESWQLAQKLQDKRSSASALRGLGELANIRGDYKRSVACYKKGLQFARECEDDEMMSMLLQNLGSQASRRGDYSLAHQYYEEGHASCKKDSEPATHQRALDE